MSQNADGESVELAMEVVTARACMLTGEASESISARVRLWGL